MQIEVSKEFGDIINNEMLKGQYSSPEEFLQKAVNVYNSKIKTLNELLQVGIDQANRGEVHEYDQEDIDQRVKEKIAAMNK